MLFKVQPKITLSPIEQFCKAKKQQKIEFVLLLKFFLIFDRYKRVITHAADVYSWTSNANFLMPARNLLRSGFPDAIPDSLVMELSFFSQRVF